MYVPAGAGFTESTLYREGKDEYGERSLVRDRRGEYCLQHVRISAGQPKSHNVMHVQFNYTD